MPESQLPSFNEVQGEVEKIYDLYNREEAIRQLARYVIESIEEALLLARGSVPAHRLQNDLSLVSDLTQLERGNY